jgi:GBP family porin
MAQYNRPASTTNPSAAVDDSLYGYTSPFTKSLTGAAVQRQRIFGAGATYDFGFLCATLGYSNVLFEYTDTTGLRVQNGELTLTRRLSPEWLVGLGYIFTVGNYSAGEQVHYNQVNLGAVYSLSKRTDLFLVGVGQRAGGDASYAQIYSLPASSSKVQIAVTGGIRLRF